MQLFEEQDFIQRGPETIRVFEQKARELGQELVAIWSQPGTGEKVAALLNFIKQIQ